MTFIGHRSYDLSFCDRFHPYLVKVPGSRCYQFYLAQTEEARYLKNILDNPVKFSTFLRDWQCDVIVDCHPEYPPITPQESDSSIISNIFLAIFGNYASEVQKHRPVWLENGLGTCFTLINFQQAMNSQMTSFLSKLIKKILVDQANHFMFLRRFKIMWLMIDAINNGYVEFRAMIYGGHPGRNWSGLLEEAHFLVIGHFNSLGRSVIFKLTLIKSPHFCAVIHGYDHSQRLLMDFAVAEFVGVDEC